MITPDVHAEIRRLFFAEHWKIGTIAAQLFVHRDTVRRAVDVDSFASEGLCRPSKMDPYRELIEKTLEQYPKLRASRIHEMIVARGYAGSVGQTRRAVAGLRPRPKAEAYLRLFTLRGEQAQVDWGHFGKVTVGRAQRPLMAFVMVLSHSRAVHVLFTLDASMESFLRGHVDAFAYFGGSARTILYDNLKSAVLERRGDLIRFHPRLLELSGHYQFQPQPCTVARGNEKGRVERLIRFLRDRFFAARTFHDVDDLNRQFVRWREEWAHQRPCPGDERLTVAEALTQERPLLLPLPEHPFACEYTQTIKSGKTPYVRFDLNDYSIPHELVRKPLMISASCERVRLLDGAEVVADHPRCWSRKETVENALHIQALARQKRSAARSRAQDRLTQAVPASVHLFEQLIERNMNMRAAAVQYVRMLDDYGIDEMAVAVDRAVECGTCAPSALAWLLEDARRARGQRPVVPIELPDNPKVRDLRVPRHNLENYDALLDFDTNE